MDALLAQIGENVDQLVTIDVLSYGVIGPLARAARARQGGSVCLAAAAQLRARVVPGDAVILTTGFILPGHEPYPETDGPVGTAVLARALALGLRARVVVVAEEELAPVLTALLRTAELQVIAHDAFRGESGTHRPAACVLPLSRDEAAAAAQADEYVGQDRVRAVVAIEKAGANAKGVYHMVGGSDVSAGVAKAVALFTAARRRGLLTIGVGDRGNELGFGPLADVVQGLLPFGKRCRCPCGGGVADETPADLAVPAVVSNWGAYGIAACLGALVEDPGVLHTPELERELLWTAVRAGAVDGMTGRAMPAADGIGLDVNAGVVALLGEVYRAQSARNPSPFSTPLIKRS
jgi:D-glutamate cyclase